MLKTTVIRLVMLCVLAVSAVNIAARSRNNLISLSTLQREPGDRWNSKAT